MKKLVLALALLTGLFAEMNYQLVPGRWLCVPFSIVDVDWNTVVRFTEKQAIDSTFIINSNGKTAIIKDNKFVLMSQKKGVDAYYSPTTKGFYGFKDQEVKNGKLYVIYRHIYDSGLRVIGGCVYKGAIRTQ